MRLRTTPPPRSKTHLHFKKPCLSSWSPLSPQEGIKVTRTISFYRWSSRQESGNQKEFPAPPEHVGGHGYAVVPVCRIRLARSDLHRYGSGGEPTQGNRPYLQSFPMEGPVHPRGFARSPCQLGKKGHRVDGDLRNRRSPPISLSHAESRHSVGARSLEDTVWEGIP